MPDREKILDPAILARIANLTLKARHLADGVLGGLHKSRHTGVSIEFASHKEYSPGDPIRHLDWKVFGKSDKYYIKRYEEETNRRTLLIVDASGSMGYGSAGQTKFEAAAVLSAALAYLTLAQNDAVGLLIFNDRETNYIPPRPVSTHLQTIVAGLAAAEPAGPTNIAGSLGNLSERLSGRGLLVIISDLFDDPAAVRRLLKVHHSRRQEIIVFHLLDPSEIKFPFQDLTLFQGMEETIDVLAEPEAIAAEYRRLVAKFIDEHRNVLEGEGIDYQLFDLGQPIEETLAAFLARRQAAGRRLLGARRS